MEPEPREASGAWWRALLVLPSVVFVAANLLKFELGIDGPYDFLAPVIGPSSSVNGPILAAVVILGPLAAVVLTLRRTASISVSRTGGGLSARTSLNVQWADLVILVFALGALSVIGLYLIAEGGI
ncbi:MAG: hypothetical protein ACRDHM_11040 [Actinomycetota bacterium]